MRSRRPVQKKKKKKGMIWGHRGRFKRRERDRPYSVRMKQLLRFKVVVFLVATSNTVPSTYFVFALVLYLREHSARDVTRKAFA